MYSSFNPINILALCFDNSFLGIVKLSTFLKAIFIQDNE